MKHALLFYGVFMSGLVGRRIDVLLFRVHTTNRLFTICQQVFYLWHLS